jgi:apolipoprotein N-acyltransferase
LRELTQRLAAWLMLATPRGRYGAMFAAGLASALAMPPIDFFPVLFLTLPILVWAVDATAADPDRRWLTAVFHGMLPGWWFGFGYFLAGLWWIGNALLVEAELFAWAIPLAVIALPAALAIFWGLASLGCALLWCDGLGRIGVLTFMLAGAEYLRGTLFTGFPWNTIGYAAMPVPIAMQSASLVGLYGITLLAIPAFSLPLTLLADRSSGSRIRAVAFLAVFFLIAGHLAYGAYRLSVSPETLPEPDIRIRLVQPNIDQRQKFDPSGAEDIVAGYIDLSKESDLDNIRYVIWPESAFPFLLTERADVLSAIADLLPASTQLITGAMRAEPGSADEPYGRVYNSVYLIDSNGEIIQAADKVHLVPFGEYLPFQPWLEAVGLEQLTRIRGGFEPGVERRLLQVETNHPFIALICYEIIFPSKIRPSDSDQQPSWILNLTNDAWFGHTPGPYQHFRFAQIRGVEEGLPVARVANTGISGVSDAFGRVAAKIDFGERGIADLDLPGKSAATFYSLHRNFPFFLLLALAACFFPFRRRD